MIPIRDVIPTPTAPWATLGIIALNATLFVFGQLGPAERHVLSRLEPASGRVVAFSLFDHAGPLHVAVNMAALWLFGGSVEDRLGRIRFLLLYTLAGSVALLLALLAHPLARLTLIGSGGAVAGVAAAYFYLFPKSQVLVLVPMGLVLDLVEVPAVFLVALWLLLSAAGATAGVEAAAGGFAASAHLAGLMVGFGLAPVLTRKERLRVEWWDRVIRRSSGGLRATRSPAR
jgi:membrane associated rhomboid family serine protease